MPRDAHGAQDDGDGAGGHGALRNDRVQQREHRQGHGHDVVGEGPEQVLPNDLEDAPGERYRVGHPGHAALYDHDVRVLHGQVAARPHGHADVRALQGRGIVDPVAGHHNLAPPGLPVPHEGQLVVRPQGGAVIVDPDPGRDAPRRALVVPRRHDDLDPHLAEPPHGLRGVLPNGVLHGDEAQHLVARAHLDDRPAKVELRPIDVRVDRTPDEELPPPDRRAHPLARGLRHLRDLGIARGSRGDGLGQGMGRRSLDGGRGVQQLRRQVRLHDLRSALRQGPRLVQDRGAQLTGRLYGLGVADQQSALRGRPRPRDERHGNGEPERAGAGDHQRGDEGVQRFCGAGRPQEGEGQGRRPVYPIQDPPERTRQHGQQEYDGDETVRHPVREGLDGNFRPLGLANQRGHAREEAVLPHRCGPYAQGARQVQGTSRHRIPYAAGHGDGLPRQHGLIDRRRAPDDLPVHGDALARQDDHDVSRLHRFDRDLDRPTPLLLSAALLSDIPLSDILIGKQQPRRGHGEGQKRPHLFRRPVPEPGLDVASREVQGHDHRRYGAERGEGRVGPGDEHRAPGGKRAQRDQHVHVGVPVREGDPRAPEDTAPDPEEDEGPAHRLDERHGLHDALHGSGVRPRPAVHVQHHQDHERNDDGPGKDHPAPRRTIPLLLPPLAGRASDVVARLAHRPLQDLPRHRALQHHEGAVRRQVHRRKRHSIDLRQLPLHHLGTGRAGHPGDVEADLLLSKAVFDLPVSRHVSLAPPGYARIYGRRIPIMFYSTNLTAIYGPPQGHKPIALSRDLPSGRNVSTDKARWGATILRSLSTCPGPHKMESNLKAFTARTPCIITQEHSGR